jgi:hypothetical protein
VFRDCGSGLAEHIGNDGVKGNIAYSKDILEAVFFAAPARYEFVTVPRIFAEYAKGLFRDKAAGDKAEAKKIADPLGIFGVVLVPFDSFDPLWVSDSDRDLAFKKIVDRNPVLACGFHADVEALVVCQPLPERQNGLVESGKPLLLVVGGYPLGCDDCGDEKLFVDIDAATDRINDFHKQNLPSVNIDRRADIDWAVTHLTKC